MNSFMISSYQQVLLDDLMKGSEVDGACDTWSRGIAGNAWRKGTTWRTIIEGKIIVKWFLNRMGGCRLV